MVLTPKFYSGCGYRYSYRTESGDTNKQLHVRWATQTGRNLQDSWLYTNTTWSSDWLPTREAKGGVRDRTFKLWQGGERGQRFAPLVNVVVHTNQCCFWNFVRPKGRNVLTSKCDLPLPNTHQTQLFCLHSRGWSWNTVSNLNDQTQETRK
jgi:hypothetical protein